MYFLQIFNRPNVARSILTACIVLTLLTGESFGQTEGDVRVNLRKHSEGVSLSYNDEFATDILWQIYRNGEWVALNVSSFVYTDIVVYEDGNRVSYSEFSSANLTRISGESLYRFSYESPSQTTDVPRLGDIRIVVSANSAKYNHDPDDFNTHATPNIATPNSEASITYAYGVSFDMVFENQGYALAHSEIFDIPIQFSIGKMSFEEIKLSDFDISSAELVVPFGESSALHRGNAVRLNQRFIRVKSPVTGSGSIVVSYPKARIDFGRFYLGANSFSGTYAYGTKSVTFTITDLKLDTAGDEEEPFPGFDGNFDILEMPGGASSEGVKIRINFEDHQNNPYDARNFGVEDLEVKLFNDSGIFYKSGGIHNFYRKGAGHYTCWVMMGVYPPKVGEFTGVGKVILSIRENAFTSLPSSFSKLAEWDYNYNYIPSLINGVYIVLPRWAPNGYRANHGSAVFNNGDILTIELLWGANVSPVPDIDAFRFYTLENGTKVEMQNRPQFEPNIPDWMGGEVDPSWQLFDLTLPAEGSGPIFVRLNGYGDPKEKRIRFNE